MALVLARRYATLYINAFISILYSPLIHPDQDPIALLFTLVWIAVFAYILWHMLKSCFRRQPNNGTRRPSTGHSRPSPGSGWFSGFRPDDDRNDPPPPYTKYPGASVRPAVGDWRPGFWTGAALGGLGTYLAGNTGRRDSPTATAYDWERAHAPRASPVANPGVSGYSTSRRPFFSSDDRGEGPSSLGSMRRSTGLGGSNVR